MSKKVQVSTVRQTADVEVIFINANLISKVIKSHIALDDLIRRTTDYGGIGKQDVYKTENGELLRDENGDLVIDKDKVEYIYQDCRMDSDILKDLNETVLPFLKELVEAFDA